MAIINFFVTNWDSILIVVSAVGLIVGLIAKGQFNIIKQAIFALVTEAERKFGGGTGKAKLAEVVKEIHSRIPGWLRNFISQQMLENLIDSVLKNAKVIWETNPDIKAYIASGAASEVAAAESSAAYKQPTQSASN